MEFLYFGQIRNLMDTVVQEESAVMEQAVELLVAAIKRKSSIFMFGASHAGILTQELFYRAGGLAVINPIFAKELMLDTAPITHTSAMEQLVGYGRLLAEKTPLRRDDVLIIHSVSGRNPVAVELAAVAVEKGVSVIGLTNLDYSRSVESRHPTGKRLFELCDLVLDNHGEPGDACVAVEGLEQKVGPSSTVIGAAILNAIMVEVTRKLAAEGEVDVPVFYSANIDGGSEKNRHLMNNYSQAIHYDY
ncbi:MAG: SIS domain-containing protein [Angelakisella sp.]